MTARERRGDHDPLSHPGRAVADPAVEDRSQAQCFMPRTRANADIVDAPADESRMSRPRRASGSLSAGGEKPKRSARPARSRSVPRHPSGMIRQQRGVCRQAPATGWSCPIRWHR